MNPDQIKPPLHILDEQVDPDTKPKKPEISQKPIRTYEGDVAEAMARQKSSIMTMAIAEGERKTGEKSLANKPPSQAPKKIFVFILSLVFIGAGIGGGYFLYLKSPLAKTPITPSNIKITSIISPDIQNVTNIPSLQKENLIKSISTEFKNHTGNQDKLIELVLAQNMGSTTRRITGSQFIASLDLNITDTLKRSLTDRWMLGVYNDFPFIILTTDFFQNAFAGMLKWESTMPEELADLLNYRSEDDDEYYNIRGIFEDRIISNRDIRQFTNQNGQTLLLYSFIDKNTLLITTSESVIPGLLERIEKQTYIR